jgi:Superinfection immunity protein
MSGRLYAYNHDGRAPFGWTEVLTEERPRTGHVTTARVCAVLTLGYLAPWAVAAGRGRPDSGRIGMINLFTGWTVIGWIAALGLARHIDV